MEQTKNNKKRIATIIGLVVVLVLVIVVKQFGATSFDKAMIKAASELNKTCPIMVDQETRLDNAEVIPENIFQYNYTLVNLIKDSIDIALFDKYMTPVLLKGLKEDSSLRIYKENNVTMAYNYKDKNGVFISEISITPDLYSE